jgi:hypothetical protein
LSILAAASAIASFKADTVELIPSESETNSGLERTLTRSSRFPSVIFSRERLT